MNARTFALTPRWIMFDQFWIALKSRNRRLIILRYGAIIMLALFLAGAVLLPELGIPVIPVALVTLAILLYNVLLHQALKTLPAEFAPFHGLHFALIQISADLVALLVLTYYTGGVESPFLLFYLFHIIIASLILPSAIVALIIAAVLGMMFGGALLELSGVIAHHPIHGLFPAAQYTNGTYIAVQFAAFAFTFFVINYLANSISKELYLRERSLTRAYKQLEEAEKTKSRYVMSVVHDLKTPIAAAITYLNMLLDKSFGELSDEMERPIERSRVRLQGAITLINDILQLSQVKLASDVEVQDVNLSALISEIYEEMRILFMAKKIRFSTWTNAENDVHVEAEPKLLKLAIANIISNAHKYSENDSTVEVHLKEIDGLASIEVADSGIGIPEGEIDKIFQDFYRTGISKKKSEGTGLGLSIVKQIIHQFNGTVHVESPSRLQTPDRPGTAFFIMLPRTFKKADVEDEE